MPVANVNIKSRQSGDSGANPAYTRQSVAGLIAGRHPGYDECHWDIVEATYVGGRGWFKDNIHRYFKEGLREFRDRVARAHRVNHTRQVVDTVNKYLFRVPVDRKVDDAPECLKDFWKKATRDGEPIDSLMNEVSTESSKFGKPWVVVDNNMPAELADKKITKSAQKRLNFRVYAYVVDPRDVLNFSISEDGVLNWVLIRELWRDDADPFASDMHPQYRYRLWTQQEWVLFKRVGKVDNKAAHAVDYDSHGTHGLGVVPCVPCDHVITRNRWKTPSMVDDIVYMDKAVANYASNMDAIIQDQTFSQLAIPAQGLMPGTTAYKQMLEMGMKRAFLYDAEGGSAPTFISPDVKQVEVIAQTISSITNQIYQGVGLSGERSKTDNAIGQDNSSGVAKAYDFEKINALLHSKSKRLEKIEFRISEIVCAYWDQAEKNSFEELIKYPTNFDVKGLYDEFEAARNLFEINAPEEIRREQMILLMEKLFPRMSKETVNRVTGSLKDWPKDPVEMTSVTDSANPSDKESKPLAKKANNAQGQVTGRNKE